MIEVGLLRRRRQFAVEKQVAGLEEVAMLGELLDRIAAVEQDPFVAVDEGDLRFAGGGRRESGIVGEDAGLLVESADIDDLRTERPVADCKIRTPDPLMVSFAVLSVIPDLQSRWSAWPQSFLAKVLDVAGRTDMRRNVAC